MDSARILKERAARKQAWSNCGDKTSITVSMQEDFVPMETDDATGGEVTIDLVNEEYPSTMKIRIPSSQKQISCTDSKKAMFEQGVDSSLQVFLSSRESKEYKLSLVQMMAVLTEEQHHRSHSDLSTEVIGGHPFVLAKDAFWWLVKRERHTYTEREVWLITELRSLLMIDISKTLSHIEMLHYAQNHLWFMMRTALPSENELFKKKMLDVTTTLAEMSRLTRENKKFQ